MQKLNLPNKLTVIRMFLAPVYLALMLIEFPYHYLAALVVFSIASITDLLDGSYTASDRVTTAAAQKEVLEITGLTLVSSTGDTYEADVKDGKATLTIEKAEYITLKGSSSVANAKFTFNGETVNPDTASGRITVTPGEDTIVAVTLTSGVTGTVVDATLTVSVRK